MRCQDVAILISASQDRTLSFWELSRLRIHLALCRYCSRYDKSIRGIRTIMQAYATLHAVDDDHESDENIQKNLVQQVWDDLDDDGFDLDDDIVDAGQYFDQEKNKGNDRNRDDSGQDH